MKRNVLPTRLPTRRQRGQSLTEYTIVCVLVGVGLFAGNPSVAQQLASAVKAFYRAFSLYISLP